MYIKIHFSGSSTPQCWSKAVICSSITRMYSRSEYFLVPFILLCSVDQTQTYKNQLKTMILTFSYYFFKKYVRSERAKSGRAAFQEKGDITRNEL